MNHWQKREKRRANETRGVNVTVAGYEGWSFRVKPMAMWAPDYQRAIVRVSAQPAYADYLARVKAGDYVQTAEDAELDRAMMTEAFAEGCLAGWGGVDGPDGEPMHFSKANAVAVLNHFPEIYAELRAAAGDPARFDPPSPSKKAAVARGN